MDSRRLRAALVAAVVAGLAAAGIAIPGGDDEPAPQQASPPSAATEDVGRATFPGKEEADEIGRTLDAIYAGESLPYEEDGQTFQNREGLLPDHPIGYYREYTVPTPGSPDRGARRLVIGEGGETYYTDDHYTSFTEIDPEDYR